MNREIRKDLEKNYQSVEIAKENENADRLNNPRIENEDSSVHQKSPLQPPKKESLTSQEQGANTELDPDSKNKPG